MKRLAILLLVLMAPAVAHTAIGKAWRLGELAPSAESLEITQRFTLPELARLGFREGDNLVVDHRVGDPAALPGLARDMVLANPDAIIAIGPDAMRAAAEITKTVPIVTFGSDPVQLGLAASLARPGGNVTGVVILGEKLDGKRLDVLHEAVPAARRVAALLLSSQPNESGIEREMRALAVNSGIELLVFESAGRDDYLSAFAAMRAAKAQALVITGSATFNRDMVLLAKLALEAGLPTACEWAENAHAGCLLGYGPSRPELRRRIAYLVARIFGGAPPGTLPIETPTRFELTINLKTAQALGLTIPQPLLVRADELIE